MRYLLLLLCLPLPASAAEPTLPAPVSRKVVFVKDVQPILAASCYSCHGEKKQKGDLRLDEKASALRPEILLPGKSANSSLIHRVAGVKPDERMPPSGDALTAEQIGILRAWIDQGAAWPQEAKKEVHWAYRPLVAPTIPVLSNEYSVVNPIDRFIIARLQEKGLRPSPEADRRTLIRRLTFNLHGLPATPAEIEAFENDASTTAYEKLVERLLASPRYGERWARHWMDVIHYAETHGHDQDVPREHAWPYRDYLIRSLNADKPYSRFIEEQIAGDVLFPDDPQALVATGMLAAGPWDESSQKDIRDDTIDKKAAQNIDRDDIVATVMGAFVSSTVHCARCHDHKFDPISQREYYGLQAAFAGVDRANRAYDSDPAVARRRTELKHELTGLESGGTSAAKLLSSDVQNEVAAWERARGRDAWTVLDPATFATANGSQGTKLPDRSVRFSDTRPETDTYTITASTGLKVITGVRLEVLTDDALPHKGPGRQDNGNLHLSEFRLLVTGKAVALRSPAADFNQQGWTIQHALDGNPKTAWGIYPEVGKAHHAVFELSEPLRSDVPLALTFVLEQLHGGGHLIGRPRLSATDAPNPATMAPLPERVAQILAVVVAQRSDVQKAELAAHVLKEKVAGQLAALPPQQHVYAAAPDFTPLGSFKPAKGCRPVHVLRRGDINHPLDAAVPGALSCIGGLESRFALPNPADEGARRAALARWISARGNVLTWRSIVNRVWHYHFGRGLCATPNDLGKMGLPPTHPDLLDYLAARFRDDGGSLKNLHRLIVTSAAYRQTSVHRADLAMLDSDNALLWRMNRTRLDAESVRDAALAVSGKLDSTMHGPSVKHFVQSPGIHVTPLVDYNRYDPDHPHSFRRAVYRFVFRTLPDPLLDTLDCPDASQFMPARASSVTPLQALALLNDKFMVRQSEHFAARLSAHAMDHFSQVQLAYQLALGRRATDAEATALTQYAKRYGLPNACRLLLNCNEFIFVP